MEQAESLSPGVEQADPARFFWYAVYVLIMGVAALPLFGAQVPPITSSYMTLLVIHEASGFLFFGHTFFSNIWGPNDLVISLQKSMR